MAETVKVTGGPEVDRAFQEVARKSQDLTEAHKREAEALLTDVQRFSRFKSGALSMGWQAASDPQNAQFVNSVAYAGVQEFGWAQRNIEPTLAVPQAFEANEAKTEEIYGDAIRKIADGANIETR